MNRFNSRRRKGYKVDVKRNVKAAEVELRLAKAEEGSKSKKS